MADTKPENRAAKSPQSEVQDEKDLKDGSTKEQKDAERVPTTVVRDGK